MELNYENDDDEEKMEGIFGMNDMNEINEMNDEELFELLDQIDYDKENKEINDLEQKITESEKGEKYCKTCKSGDSIAEDTAQGILVCLGCGTIMSELFDETGEWKQYFGDDGKESQARCTNGINFFLPQSSLGTQIGGSRNRVKLLHSWNAMPYKERSLNIVIKEIQSKCRAAGILKCIEDDAKILYKNISESKHLYGKHKGKNVIIRGSNRKSLIASCVFFACKRKGKTRSPKEIAKLFDLKYKEITRGCKIFMKLIKLNHLHFDLQVSNVEQHVTRYCRLLHISNEYIEQAIKIAKNIQKINIASMHTPFSLATGSISLVVEINNLNIDKKDIADKFNVSDVTVTKAYKKLEQYKNVLMNDELTDTIAKLLDEDKKKLVMPDKLKQIYNKIHENKKFLENVSDDEIEISESSDEILKDKNEKVSIFTINDIDEYINNKDVDLYDNLSTTEENYKSFIKVVII